jgi:hypothetical protein
MGTGTYKSVELDVEMVLARSILVNSLGGIEDKVSRTTTNRVSHGQRNLIKSSLAGLTWGIEITKQDLSKSSDSVQHET